MNFMVDHKTCTQLEIRYVNRKSETRDESLFSLLKNVVLCAQ